jgi:LEM3 (ligand-effect modulator 3) family / CDC50 family
VAQQLILISMVEQSLYIVILPIVCSHLFIADVFVLDTPGRSLDETGISWKSDRETKYKQHHSFKYALNPTGGSCDTVLQLGARNYTDTDGIKYCYLYADDATTQYLFESYPQISPIKGVTDEHFIVWMRTASMPDFRKLYGRINGNFAKGDVITFNVTANFETRSLKGSKSLVLSTAGELFFFYIIV